MYHLDSLLISLVTLGVASINCYQNMDKFDQAYYKSCKKAIKTIKEAH